ncbi:hypothetical protein BUALT_Bualt12G0037200 [Buddleja alternifolia]|uniref:NB-ARC domain-containing protein n=1 Tax=Buddleja alternifolia TaxID=168488 RepID=A0AAV6WNN1_9LAMI|nr:hypothetical protein BUALT_Bualt12G0037200 [Buddleja alternifolia]
MQDFLEVFPHDLESRISHAAHAAEDLIESAIVDRIHGVSKSNSEGNDRDLFKDLEQVIKDMDIIKKEAMGIKLKNDDKLTRRYSMAQVGSSRLPSSARGNTTVGFDDCLTEIMDKLTGQQSKRLIIPIVGMGGIGKTTLARNVYVNPLIVEYFDICAWVTITQDYNVREILLEVLVSSFKHERESLSGMSEEELGENVYKCLCGRRYLIVMDDIWNTEAWDKLKFYFPDNNNGSRLLITTRLSKLAFHLMGSNGFEMKLLDEDKSWILFSQKVFGEEVCPPELEEIGKKIAKCCKGLPLSIAVIGGLLAKSERTRQYWEYIAKNLNPIVNLEDDACCLKILSLSYTDLPIHLKPCFLYMGVFPEDDEIRVSRLIKLWVAEGFLKPISGKSLEVVAGDYFNDLIDRNLILEHKWVRGYSGKTKFCKIHDLLRDLCLREARKEKFFCVPKENSPDSLQCVNTQRRIAVHPSTSNEEYSYQLLHGLQSSSIARSVIWDLEGHLPSLNCRLLRVLEDHSDYMPCMGPLGNDEYFIKDILQLVNLRYLTLNVRSNLISEFPSSMCLLWNLQTLILIGHDELVIAPSEIWQMSQLRHLYLWKLCLPDPPSVEEEKSVVVLRNLRTLLRIKNFKCGEDVVNRIPNIKKLRVFYEGPDEGSGRDSLINLGRLTKLESFSCTFDSIKMPFLQSITFPHSLRKLTLKYIYIYIL